MIFIFGACGGKTKSYIGTWIGQQESVLILKDDGTCKYKDGGDDETEDGIWEIQDKQIIVKNCVYHDGQPYDIYADIDDSDESLLFESDNSHWNDELFIKSN